MKGWSNWMDLSPLLNDIDIVCVSETWMTSSPQFCPPFNFNLIDSPAVRTPERGRASGGLVIALNTSKYKYKTIKITEQNIFVEINSCNGNFIIGVIYLKPDSNIDLFCIEFNEIIALINNNYPNLPLFVGGDFNVRIDDLNQLNDEILPENVNITSTRSNLDKVINKKGRELVR